MKSALRASLVIASSLVSWSCFAQQQPALGHSGTLKPASTSAAVVSKSDVALHAASNRSNGVAPASADVSRQSSQAGDAGARETTAPEPADEEDAFKHSPAVQFVARITRVSLTTAYWLCVAINFAILAVAILALMRSSLPAMFRGRTQEIQKGIQEARRSSEDAGRRLKEIEVRLSRLDTEIAEMRKRAESEASAEEERIRASIDEEKQKILLAAEQEVGQAANAARRELQKYAAELAIDIARQRIHVDAAGDRLLVADFAQQLTSQSRGNGNK
jgi:F-type H+-transporting ATPase subunit b